MTYKPKRRGEADAMEMWHEAAAKGGLFWGMMVGNYRSTRGDSALNDQCSCTREGNPDDWIGPRLLSPHHLVEVHAAERLTAVRDVFEKTWTRRASRLRRWIAGRFG